MKHEYTDTELQSAIDEACLETHREHRGRVGSNLVIDTDAMPSVYAAEASARLDLIKSALAALPEPVDEESMLLNLLAVIHRDGGHYQAEHGTRKAVEDACKEWQRLILIAEKTGLTEPPTVDGKTPGQVAWDAGNEVQKRKFPNEPVMSWQEGDELDEQLEVAAAAVLAAFGNQSQAVEEANARAEKAEAELAVKTEQWETQRISLEQLFQKLNAMDDGPQLSQLRPLAEAGEVPEGCVRVTGYKSQHSKTGWVVTDFTYHGVTHFADIQPPAAKAKCLFCEGSGFEEEDHGHYPCRSGCKPSVKAAHADEPTPEPLATKPISLPTPNEAISLRDWLAGQALTMLADPDFSASPEDTAKLVYRIADAMLKAREVKP